MEFSICTAEKSPTQNGSSLLKQSILSSLAMTKSYISLYPWFLALYLSHTKHSANFLKYLLGTYKYQSTLSTRDKKITKALKGL